MPRELVLNGFGWLSIVGRPPLSADIRPVLSPCGLCCNPVALFSHETGLPLKSDGLLRLGFRGVREAGRSQPDEFGGAS